MHAENALIGKYIETSGIPAMVFGTGGKLLEWNPPAEDLFPEIKAGSSAGSDIRTAILKRVSPETRIRLKYLFETGAPHFEIEFPSGTREDRHWHRMFVSRQADGNRFALVQDITGQKIKERHLMLAKKNAEAASSSRSQFLANISHEIRTPIQTIIGMMELLGDTKLDEEQTEYSRQVRFSADVMLTLINDILDFSKVEAGQLKIEHIDFDFADVVERTVDLISMEAHKKGLEICITMAPSVPARVKGDPGRLQQILLNLVKNAVKFTSQGSIIVSAECKNVDKVSIHNDESRWVHFEVRDTGIGITDDVKSKLFNQFVQADTSTTRKYGGTGLGLAISKNLVHLMEGEIGVKDNFGGGSLFWFDLPMAASKEQPVTEPLQLDPSTRFLLVDDNGTTLDILEKMLASLGYENVQRATSGSLALRKLRSASHAQLPFDIVLIDMIMPEMDGWRLAAEINANREINQAQLYLMVPEGSFGADAKMKLLEWFNGYLYKPVKQRRLVELLREHWQSSIDLEVVEEIGELQELDEDEELQTNADVGRSAAAQREPQRADVHTAAPPAAKTAEAPDAESAAEAKEPVNFSGITVLVAEDHPVNSKLLKIFLEKAGASVLLAEDGHQATELISKNTVDIVFMDIQMPRKNGYEASAWIRQNGYKQPIIACTASAQENEREKCISFGMNEILPKPYKRNDVYRIVETFVQKPEQPKRQGGNMSETKSPQHNPEIFDAKGYLEIMGDDETIAASLVAGFLEQTTRHMKTLRDALAQGDFGNGRRTAHLIKGSSLNITANRFAAAAKEIECAPEDTNTPGFAERFKKMNDAFIELRGVLKAQYPRETDRL